MSLDRELRRILIGLAGSVGSLVFACLSWLAYVEGAWPFFTLAAFNGALVVLAWALATRRLDQESLDEIAEERWDPWP